VFESLLNQYLESLLVKGFTEATARTRRKQVESFLEWLKERGIDEPLEVTRPVLERYQRYLFHYRKKNGEPMSFRSQHALLVAVRQWFRWMTRQNHIMHNPASELELPKQGHHLPKHVLNVREAEQVLQQPEMLDQNQANHASPAPNGFYLQLLNLPPPCARTAATDSQGNTTGWSGCQ
jgi:integrase/recombinase XerD